LFRKITGISVENFEQLEVTLRVSKVLLLVAAFCKMRQ